MNYLSLFLLSAASVLLAAPLSAQTIAIKLKNGHTVTGRLVAHGDCPGMRVSLFPGDTLCIPAEQYQSHRYRPYLAVPEAATEAPDSLWQPQLTRRYLRLLNRSQRWSAKTPPPVGWYGRVAGSVSVVRQAFYTHNDKHVQGALWLDVGYRLSSRLAIGLSTGYDDLPVDQVPVYADVQYRFAKEKPSSYYVQGRAGYGLLVDKFFHDLDTERTYRGGLAAYPSLGYSWATYRERHWFVELGYKLNRFRRIDADRPDYHSETRIRYARYTLRVGVEF